MLLTIIEILVFMILAAFVGLILGWLLRGVMGDEQAELTDLRSKLRACKKANRESASSSKPTNKVVEKVKATNKAASQDASDANKPAAAKASKEKASKESVSKPESAGKKKAKSDDKAAKASKPKPTASAVEPSDDEKAAEQAAARVEVAKLVERLGSDDRKDDLTAIYGVGPKYAGILNDLGIQNFKQVTQFSKDDINMVAAAIGAFKDRVERDDWVTGAKTAYKEKYGEDA